MNALLKVGYDDDALVSILHAFMTKISSTIQVIVGNVVHTFGFIHLEINWNQQQSLSNILMLHTVEYFFLEQQIKPLIYFSFRGIAS